MDIKKRMKDDKNVGVQWIGPCTVVNERPSQLYVIKHKCEIITMKYLKVHPEFLILYVGQSM